MEILWNCAIKIINPFEMCNQTISVIRWTKCYEYPRRLEQRRGEKGLVGFVKSYRSTRMRKRFDRDRNTERKIRLNDESATKFNMAYRKFPLSLPSRIFARSFVREFHRHKLANARSLARSLTPKAFRRIKFSRIVYDKMFPFNLSNHRRTRQTFANSTDRRD